MVLSAAPSKHTLRDIHIRHQLLKGLKGCRLLDVKRYHVKRT